MDVPAQFAETIREAVSAARPICIRGGGTKDFYGGTPHGECLSTTAYRGIVSYEPTELVITARCGTPLAEIEQTMRENGQMLAFEPPYFGAEATIGGCVAAGLSGPRRPYAGAVRDFVLGVRVLDGRGHELRFGGQVMKNVAGYDVSRLMAGSLGTLGIILEVSLKALPIPLSEVTLRREHNQGDAIALMNGWAGRPLPLSATCHVANMLYVRLSGAAAAVHAARKIIGGEEHEDGPAFWRALREHQLGYFTDADPLWRLSVKSSAPPLNLAGEQLVEWGGALRWLRSPADASTVRAAAQSAGGHATLFRAADKSAGVFSPLSPALETIHRRLKQALDPAGVFNRGRLYQWM